MAARVIVRRVVICALAILVSWATASEERRSRRDAFQATGDKTTGDVNYGGLVKASTAGEDGNGGGKAIPSGASLFQLLSQNEANKADIDGEIEFLDRYSFDKRAPSSYKLKYGGLGKRKLGSNKLRFGGLGKRVSTQDDEMLTDSEEQLQNDYQTAYGKDLLERAYFLLANNHPDYRRTKEMDELLDSDDIQQEFERRQQRSRLGKGLRYSGLGKRNSMLSYGQNN